jgi:1-deoxy-D-xylulose-5-phosphate synthase
VALLNLHVVFCFDRAGIVGEDGATHHGAFDLAALRPIPNLTISSPMDEHELRRLMYTAQLPDKGPFVIRYPRGGGVLQDWRCPLEEVKVGTGRKLKDGNDVAVLSIGPIGNNVTEAINIVRGYGGTEARGRENSLSAGSNLVPPLPRTSVPPSIAHYDMRFLKPIDEDILEEVGRRFKKIVTVENGVKQGGLGSAVLEWMNDHGYQPQVIRLGLPDQFVEHGKVCELNKIVGLDAESIARAIRS